MNKLRELEVNEIINRLKVLTDGLDGETMQYILDEVGMSWQMLSQLVKSSKHLEQVEEMISEVRGLRGEVVNNAEKRLKLILDDLIDIEKVIAHNDVKIFEMSAKGYAEIQTLLNNIRIACDLNNNEPNNWTTSEEIAKEEKRLKQILAESKRIVHVELTRRYIKSTTISVEVENNIVGEKLQDFLTSSEEIHNCLEQGIENASLNVDEDEYNYSDIKNNDGGYL